MLYDLIYVTFLRTQNDRNQNRGLLQLGPKLATRRANPGASWEGTQCRPGSATAGALPRASWHEARSVLPPPTPGLEAPICEPRPDVSTAGCGATRPGGRDTLKLDVTCLGFVNL